MTLQHKKEAPVKYKFIIVRFDRMKNLDFKVLCQDIMHYIESYNGEELHLTETFRRFAEQKSLLKNLSKKHRKMRQSDMIVDLRKKLDEMVSALMLNIKSLDRAQFDFQTEAMQLTYNTTRKLFENYVHESIFAKEGNMKSLLRRLALKDEFYDAYEHQGLLKFTDAFISINLQIKNLSEERKIDKRKLPEVGITIPSKETLIEELRYFLKSIEMTARTYPEIDYIDLISRIDYQLLLSRAQLRNLSSRRATAKAKAEKKKTSDEDELNSSS